MRHHNRGLSIVRNRPQRLNQGAATSLISNNTALASYRTARASAASSPCDILWVGDSLTEGFNVCAYGSRFQDLIIQRLKTAYPSGATGQSGSSYIPAFYSSSPSAWTGPQSYTSRTGTPSEGTGGIGGRTLRLFNVGDSQTYTFTGTGCDVLYVGHLGVYGTFIISVDGGTTEGTNQFTIDAAAAGGATDARAKQIRGLSAASHTIKITHATLGPSSLGTFHYGLVAYNGDEAKGIRGIDCAHQSWTPAAMNSSGIDGLTLFTNVKLIVMPMAGIGYVNQTALATFKSDTQTLVNNIRTNIGNATCPVLFVGFDTPGSVAAQPITYASYVQQYQDLCGSLANCALYDMKTVYPYANPTGTPVNEGGDPGWIDTADRVHLLTAGEAGVDVNLGAALLL